jgi:hypothetical protein
MSVTPSLNNDPRLQWSRTKDLAAAWWLSGAEATKPNCALHLPHAKQPRNHARKRQERSIR